MSAAESTSHIVHYDESQAEAWQSYIVLSFI
jgi:hypothetical protein